ncbi:YiiX/YebB-like N1pC/P60 family cysteine hydrolase [Guptibacillus hwajinpoensis]|uniref:YiiX/YebB-like N1pC/P60 family cysteine hydrolase n=1 Tax=Guptibacillus hwajinpoensis TaxID=208199 RepID=UPI001CFCA2D8|nr:YiiX/YebB-like N1pC/P60 family cysteine hydrolase [Pseudalkalibacillus hwajinpoensis]WLR61045.1 YiiX/YebB-like N1pC/P60 family cysteine hydrolase [Pseudalkalibacillus hwajinpoensis]
MSANRYVNLTVKNYLSARNDIQTGDLLLCSGSYPVSKIIQNVSKSQFSHVALLFRWMDRIMMLESVESYGVRIVPLSHYFQDYRNSGHPYKGKLYLARHSLTKNLDESRRNAMLRRGADLTGKLYDIEEILKILASVVIGDLESIPNDKYICSEFIQECFQKAGISFSDDGRGFIYPEHIASDPAVQPLYKLIP